MVTILGAAAAAIGICFLIFCWIGFHQAARSVMKRRKAQRAFPLHRKQARKNRQVVFFLGTLSMPLVAMVPQTAQRRSSTATDLPSAPSSAQGATGALISGRRYTSFPGKFSFNRDPWTLRPLPP